MLTMSDNLMQRALSLSIKIQAHLLNRDLGVVYID